MMSRIARHVWIVVLLPLACASASDPVPDGQIPAGLPGAGQGAGGGAGGGGDPGTGSSSGMPAPGGTTGTSSGGTTSGGTPPPASGSGAANVHDVFKGAPMFVSKLGSSNRKDDHDFGPTPNNPAGSNCNAGGCHSFRAGGTIYADYKGLEPAAGVEVRIMDAAGNAQSTWTDADGNFRISGTTVKFPYWIGVRDGTTTRPMVTQINTGQGGCAMTSCHQAGNAVGIAHVP